MNILKVKRSVPPNQNLKNNSVIMPSTIVWFKGVKVWLVSVTPLAPGGRCCNYTTGLQIGMKIVRDLMISVISLPAGVISITNVKKQKYISCILGQFKHALRDPVQ